ncbi:hypothetical protein RCL_jg22574.t1 [Rhizophagus clarus]|uniref:Uncharacterized protein n=1 Tax=Rhizophagus clarus TaxID=94130 RepID=A0A8H3MFL9_9GLOM|nr:hypothetical protein RCL_jg22574.t1 [Rhizophagus clarus]
MSGQISLMVEEIITDLENALKSTNNKSYLELDSVIHKIRLFMIIQIYYQYIRGGGKVTQNNEDRLTG